MACHRGWLVLAFVLIVDPDAPSSQRMLSVPPVDSASYWDVISIVDDGKGRLECNVVVD